MTTTDKHGSVTDTGTFPAVTTPSTATWLNMLKAITIAITCIATIIASSYGGVVLSSDGATAEIIDRNSDANHAIVVELQLVQTEMKVISKSINGDPATGDRGLRGDINTIGDRQDDIRAGNAERDRLGSVEDEMKDFWRRREVETWRSRNSRRR